MLGVVCLRLDFKIFCPCIRVTAEGLAMEEVLSMARFFPE